MRADETKHVQAHDASAATIADFGQQWTRYTTNDGYYASLELFADICGPLLPVDRIRGTATAEIGSGTGRIVRMLLDAGARHVTAVEPSDAFDVLRANTHADAGRISYVRDRGENIPQGSFDFVFSIGVLHHIPDPGPVMRAAYVALRGGGQMLIWLYGREGNEGYLRLIEPLRAITTRLPAPLLAGVCHALNLALAAYVPLCRAVSLPLRGYVNNVLAKLSREKRFLVIYDQLNPTWAKYYTRAEAIELFRGAGFADVQAHHRHGYSWTVIGTKRETTATPQTEQSSASPR